MMQVMATIVFAGAAATSGATIWAMVAPQWRRVLRLAGGYPDDSFAPLAALVQAERRIAVRHWAAASRPAVQWQREAA